MSDPIEHGLALALAGQVAVGLTPGDGQPIRAMGALQAIGLMLLNADKSDLIQETLALSEKSRVTQLANGWRIESSLEQEPEPG